MISYREEGCNYFECLQDLDFHSHAMNGEAELVFLPGPMHCLDVAKTFR
jgi:hypothetical protein